MKRRGTNEKRCHITRNLDYFPLNAVFLQNVGDAFGRRIRKLAKVK